MKTLLQITVNEDGEYGSIEYHVSGTDDLYALSQALFSVMARNPEVLAGLHAIMETCKESKEMCKRLTEGVITLPDFNKILKSN